MQSCALYLVLLVVSFPVQISCQKKLDKKWITAQRNMSWSSQLSQPSAFVTRAQYRLKKRAGGFKPSTTCSNYLGLPYLENIRRSRYSICGSTPRTQPDNNTLCTQQSSCQSTVDCFTAPLAVDGNSTTASISLCRSQNLVLDSCKFLQNEREGITSKSFPLPEPGSVKVACALVNMTSAAKFNKKLHWLRNIHHEVWWGNATQDSPAVFQACSPNSSTLVTTPTMFVMRGRDTSYAHEVEVVSMAFSFLAALDPKDVAMHGVQVVIADRFPVTSFLETWARVSRPHQLRILASDPFPPNTCFRSAFHVYASTGGIGYNANPDTVRCESAVVTGFSHWLRQLYGEGDPSARLLVTPPSAEAVAGPAAEEAGVRGLRPPAGGIVLKNVVWLSRRHMELVRLLLNASTGWISTRMVRNEAAVMAGVLSAVQEWNAESCLLQRFDRTIKSEYELSLTNVNPVHGGATNSARQTLNETDSAAAAEHARSLTGLSQQQQQQQQRPQQHHIYPKRKRKEGFISADSMSIWHKRQMLQDTSSGGCGSGGAGGVNRDDGGSSDGEGCNNVEGKIRDGSEGHVDTEGGNGGGGSQSYTIGNNMIALDKLWEMDNNINDGCRRTNVLFKFVEGGFSDDETFNMQLQTIFRTGVLVGVHGAGLAHGFFMPPGQSAVLQLLGKSFSKVNAGNIFRNMAASLGNYYEDVLYSDVDIDEAVLKAAVKRAMDFVARKVMEAQLRRNGVLRLVLVDQSHFSIVLPSEEQCPANATLWASR
ncbi:hypothetical protein Vafri_15640 [Volvox africanus]|uniref:Uncharacterized protein n=3 Tax=Volvox africanus TaxID=51714 RepID=A0A8J4F852_9CHLO|nr:hypothetical protein Vafri_15640 [Volvox africanus]